VRNNKVKKDNNNNNETHPASVMPEYLVRLLNKPAKQASDRKAWSIGLNTTWIPFFTASNTEQKTDINREALGCPLRPAYNKDGSVKFSKSGKPVIQIAKDLRDAVNGIRLNFETGLQQYSNSVYTNAKDAYIAEVHKNIEAGKPISNRDTASLKDAIVKQALSHSENEESKEPERELVPA
jgi:hypothetical protein